MCAGGEKQVCIDVVTAQAVSGKMYKKLLIAHAFGKRIKLEHRVERDFFFFMYYFGVFLTHVE